jgi:hypothetical protein
MRVLTKRFFTAAGTVGALSFATATNAFAGSSTSVKGYAGFAGTIQSAVKGNGNLPFTGMDLGLVAGVATLALLAGLLMRRVGKSRS